MKAKKGILLVNLGTPLSPKTGDVRRYLREFLMDGRVIDIGFLKRTLLVKGIIAPFRAPKSAQEYKKLWTSKGSPLLFYSVELKEKLQKYLGEGYQVELAMRYQQPTIKAALERLRIQNLDSITVVPLFPQYASATTGSVHEAVMKIVSRWQLIPTLRFIDQFANHPAFIESFTAIARPYFEGQDYDYVLFSYHGLPERQLRKADAECQCKDACCLPYNTRNRLCYRAQCLATTQALAESLNLPDSKYSVSFQSRLGKTPWIQPYTEEVITELAGKGIKKLLVFSPAFVSDCLETTIEIGETYKEQFEELKEDNELVLIESLNSQSVWVEGLATIINEYV